MMPQHTVTRSPIRSKQLRLSIQALSLILISLLLNGCIFPGVFRIDIAQGNIITEQMVQKLQPGMTRDQVLFVMGTPIIQDTLNPDRWDYVYSFSKAGATPEMYRVTLYFQNDQFVRLEGEPPPDTQLF
ncbi:MAG: outer membrane protein assembly factor BamE [Gammaproteobacteria bacterium]